MLHLYKQLLAIRRSSEVLQIGTYRSLDAADGVFVYERNLRSERVLVALNFTEGERVVRTGPGQIMLSTGLDRDEAITERLILRPNEGVLSRLESF